MGYLKDLNLNKMIVLVVLFALIACNSVKDEEEAVPYPYTEGTVRIAKWKGDRKMALSLQFDDATPGQAVLGVPALIKRGLVGTWYVNPGTSRYNTHIDTWENIAPNGGQELANHSMNHTGASDYDGIVYEVGEANKIIWRIRGHENFESLIAFVHGGGTSWNMDILKKVLAEQNNLDRSGSGIGEGNKARTIEKGATADQIYDVIRMVEPDSIWGAANFHGIAKDNGNPPMDEGWGAVWIKELEDFLDKLVERKDDIWVGGYAQVYKYIKERQKATISMKQFSEEKFTVTLTSDADPKYYNEPLSVIANLPKDWTGCLVKGNNIEQSYTVSNGIMIFDLVPNSGEVELLKSN